jgi:hypothetical protein
MKRALEWAIVVIVAFSFGLLFGARLSYAIPFFITLLFFNTSIVIDGCLLYLWMKFDKQPAEIFKQNMSGLLWRAGTYSVRQAIEDSCQNKVSRNFTWKLYLKQRCVLIVAVTVVAVALIVSLTFDLMAVLDQMGTLLRVLSAVFAWFVFVAMFAIEPREMTSISESGDGDCGKIMT